MYIKLEYLGAHMYTHINRWSGSPENHLVSKPGTKIVQNTNLCNIMAQLKAKSESVNNSHHPSSQPLYKGRNKVRIIRISLFNLIQKDYSIQ